MSFYKHCIFLSIFTLSLLSLSYGAHEDFDLTEFKKNVNVTIGDHNTTAIKQTYVDTNRKDGKSVEVKSTTLSNGHGTSLETHTMTQKGSHDVKLTLERTTDKAAVGGTLKGKKSVTALKPTGESVLIRKGNLFQSKKTAVMHKDGSVVITKKNWLTGKSKDTHFKALHPGH